MSKMRGVRTTACLWFMAASLACGDSSGVGGDAGVDEDAAPSPCDAAAIECDPDATCVVSNGEPTCVCDAGYTGDGLTCQPDECALGTDDCDKAATCTDRDDGFDCACDGAFTGDGAQATPRNPGAMMGDFVDFYGGEGMMILHG